MRLAGGAFRLASYTVHDNHLQLQNAAALTDLLASMRMLRPVLAGSSAKRKAFAGSVAA